MRGALLVAAAVSVVGLSGCASSIMEGFVGKPLQVAMAQYGPPEVVFDMPDGRRAFQWRMENQSTTPVMTYGNANIYAPPGAFASANYSQTTFGGNTVTQVCRYTMYARWNEATSAWIFESFEKPTFNCM